MTITQFNQKYRISAESKCTQEAALNADESLAYGSVEEVTELLNIAVYDKESNEEVFWYEGDAESEFIEQLYEEFNIIA